MNKIGIFGGTFDPIHNGHINLAVYFYQFLNLDKIIFIPTNSPPHKVKNSNSTNKDRLEMCKLALKEFENFEVSDLEIKRSGKSYTFQTLIDLKEIYSESRFYFILGSDMYVTIDTWKNFLDILNLVYLCVGNRGKYVEDDIVSYSKKIEKLGGNTIIGKFNSINLSSTQIRENIKKFVSIDNLLPSKVKQYINKKGIYREW